jgi:hypothetical protein
MECVKNFEIKPKDSPIAWQISFDIVISEFNFSFYLSEFIKPWQKTDEWRRRIFFFVDRELIFYLFNIFSRYASISND